MGRFPFKYLNGNLPKLSYEQTKIEGSPTFRALKKNISVRFFFQKIFLKSGLIIASISATLDLQRTNLYLGTLLFIKMCTYTTFFLETPSYGLIRLADLDFALTFGEVKDWCFTEKKLNLLLWKIWFFVAITVCWNGKYLT